MGKNILHLANTTYNITSSEEKYQPYSERLETYIVPAVFLLIFVIGVIGNGTVVFVFLKHQSMRNVPNTYLFSLALADLLVIITCVPFTSILYTMEYWPWGEAVCKISECAKDISIGVSVFTLTALSIERYYAVVYPLRRLQVVLIAVIIWLLAIGCAIPNAIFARIKYDPINGENGNTKIPYCFPFPANIPNYAKYSVIVKSLIYYIIPLIAISFFYILMAIRLQTKIPGASQQGVAAQAKARKHVARMVLIFVFLFFVCFLPQHVWLLWFNLSPNAQQEYNEWWHLVKMVGFCLSFFNSCVNPIALYFASAVFRAYFNKYLFCQNV
ncbi:unnamed protein product [Ceutorhynchus assimilis]|uniref:G-protein coupled receptors family 1 profile domain-containing protein n=1 Tax=Ceutorhynchus assimilis TaxID=467358 RepID=A0A9N9MZL8_9CUCU|nr:unnamed protein product [Ceutorhynchus assimilis]